MHKHLSTFLFITIGSFSFVATAMEKPEPISLRVFPNPLPEELTQEEEAAKNEFHKLLAKKLVTQFAAVRGISTTNVVEPEQITVSEPLQEESRSEILCIDNIKPTDIPAYLKKTDEECKTYLRRQIDLANIDSARQNAARQAIKQEKARQRQVALASRKKVTAPTIAKDLVASTFAASQVAQTASSSETTSTAVVLPTLSVSVDSITRARVVSYAEPTHSAPAAPTYENLDDHLASLEDAIPVNRNLKKAGEEIDQLLSNLSSHSPQSVNPLYEGPSSADLGPIQHVEVVDIFTSKLEDIESKITTLSQNAHVVFKGLDPRTTDIRSAHDIIQRSVTEFNQEIDQLSHQIKTQPQPGSLSAFTRLKALTNALKASAENLSKENKDLLTTPSYLAYTISMQSLLTTLNS